jgi:hypothetical protein
VPQRIPPVPSVTIVRADLSVAGYKAQDRTIVHLTGDSHVAAQRGSSQLHLPVDRGLDLRAAFDRRGASIEETAERGSIRVKAK